MGLVLSSAAMRFYLTTAIDYVNSRPHLGTAYEKVAADVIARYQRARGRDVLFLMGNDEHSQNVEKAAREKGIDPLAYCDQMEAVFREAWAALDCSFDVFIRTTEKRHHRSVQEIVRRIRERGDLFEGEYEGWYCAGCEAFKREEELQGGKCPEHLTREPQWLKEKNWFFRLSAFRDRLVEHYRRNPDFVRPEFRKNEQLAQLERGLEDISISRASASWGVEFPFDPKAKVYVWFDALINYVTGAGFPDDPQAFAKWWPADLHVIGKDITRFHCIIWPAMLLAAGIELPRAIFGHGYINLPQGRMSKSSGNVVEPAALARKYSPDAVRFYLCREAQWGQDLEYSEDRLKVRANADLANGLGNLLSRTIAMAHKYQGGRVQGDVSASPLVNDARAAVDRVCAALDAYDLQKGAVEAMTLVDKANQHVDVRAPWALAKDPAKKGELDVVLTELACVLLIAGTLLLPYMPAKMTELVRRITGRAVDPKSAYVGLAAASIPKDRVLEAGAPLFPRIEDEKPA
jgi:methionyl-tRNA synthetase